MPETIDDALRFIKSRLTDIENEKKQLVRALEHLGKNGTGNPRRRRVRDRTKAPAPTSPKHKERGHSKPMIARCVFRGQRREQLLAAIGVDPGARPSEVARSIGIRPTRSAS